MCGWGALLLQIKLIAFGLLHIEARNFVCPSFSCKWYFHFNELMPAGSLPTCTTLEHISTFLKWSKISLSSVISYFKESLFVGRKGRKKSGTDDCLVGSSCQDRKTSGSEGKRRRKPHNQDLYCGVWPGQNTSWTDFYALKIQCILKVWEYETWFKKYTPVNYETNNCFWLIQIGSGMYKIMQIKLKSNCPCNE